MTIGPTTGPNTDGIGHESCTRAVIDHCTISAGDDCIAIKAGRNADGRRVNVPSANLVIQNTQCATGHGGVTIGSEMTGGVAHVYGRDLVFSSTQLLAGHRLKPNSVRGGYIEDHVGTVRLEEFTLADQTAANTLEFIDDLVLVDVTIDGSPVTSG